ERVGGRQHRLSVAGAERDRAVVARGDVAEGVQRRHRDAGGRVASVGGGRPGDGEVGAGGGGDVDRRRGGRQQGRRDGKRLDADRGQHRSVGNCVRSRVCGRERVGDRLGGEQGVGVLETNRAEEA